ncbi:unnamed protein product [Ectocarpus sp. CCAP 1310/34]|nr:unnamed protein product [Ectocarpus sp. CCAP 1310/34]
MPARAAVAGAVGVVVAGTRAEGSPLTPKEAEAGAETVSSSSSSFFFSAARLRRLACSIASAAVCSPSLSSSSLLLLSADRNPC